MRKYSMLSRIPKQIERLQDIIDISDVACINNLRMNRNAFDRLCHLVDHVGGLVSNRNTNVIAQLTMFLLVHAHHKKNHIVGHDYIRSGRTVSKHFHGVLNAILKLHTILLMQLMPVDEDCTNERCKYCLGVLDRTYIDVRVPILEKSRYRNRKCDIVVNVLGVAAHSRVLHDAVTKDSGLRVPRENYYLCDNGYMNDDGFLLPYECRNSRPRNKEEFFNIKHSKSCNVIERAFRLLKGRWAIMRSASYYPIRVQNRIIMACVLIHNFIRTEMPIDPLEHLIVENQDWHGLNDDDYIDIVESTPDEEEVLITSLKYLITTGWKCENGFRTGYLGELENSMLKAFSRIDIRVDPYINSKIHVWKKKYGSLYSMLSRFRFG
ncbi:hypothetical protein Pfo_005182 [Paulownia fortunei]|nr:hypothetical protein Pfo_005182 [Paulownia fortunei]